MVTDEQARLVKGKLVDFGTEAVERFLKECVSTKHPEFRQQALALRESLEIVDSIAACLALDELPDATD